VVLKARMKTAVAGAFGRAADRIGRGLLNAVRTRRPAAAQGLTQIISVSFTPKSTTSRLRLRFQGEFTLLNAGTAGFALFSSASANAIKATLISTIGATLPTPVVFEYEYVPATTSALTFTVRVGPISANTMRFNGNTAARFFGGTMGATLVIEEIVP
jgi:hypothetical protein